MIKLDMHVHTLFSDAAENIEQVLEKAVERKLEYIAITDHDTCINLEDKKQLEAKYNINIITGIELTTNYKRVHLLGYGIKDLKLVEKISTMYRDKSIDACVESAKKLISDGISITLSDVYNHSKNGLITENSIVRAMIANNLFETYEEAKEKYFNTNSKYRISLSRIPVDEAIDLIKLAGGVPVLAHPFNSKFSNSFKQIEKEIEILVGLGIEGIEAYYSKNDITQTKFALHLAKKYNLFITAGSDYHAVKGKNKLGMEVPYELEIIKYIY